jgi:synaptotagmin-like protein
MPHPQDQPYNVNPNSGQLQLALKFAPKETESGVTRGTLSVQIQRACNLTTSEEETGKPDPYVKCSLLPSAAEQRKTAVVKNSSSPSWRESFLFESVSLEELARGRVLEVTVWDFNRGTSNDFIGGLHIGPAPSGTSRDREWMDSIQEEAAHWEAILAHPGEWTERWHTLRKTMEPRSADLSAPQSNNSQVGDEFRKVVSKSSSASPRESPVLSVRSHSQLPSQQPLASAKKQDRLFQHTSSPLSQTKPKPVENRFPELGSNPSLPRSASPLASTQSHSSIPNAAPYVPPSEISTSNDPLSSRSVSPEVSSGDAIERSPNQKPPAGPLKRAGLLGVKHSGSHSSFGSQLSIYSAAGGGKGNYDITGEVLVGISYNGGQLLVHVNRARDLAAADSNGSSDPYLCEDLPLT